MILRKPYAFFIKVFKPMHILMSFFIVYLIYKTNNILSFFNTYIYSNNSVVGQEIKESLVSSELIIIPIIIILFSLIFLGVMYIKKKPVTFYVITIFLFLITLIITIYSSNFLGIMEKSIVSLKLVKLYHDLVLINMIVESSIFIILIIRGLGINFKKFNFDSDITNLNISDSDKEEFELNVNIDVELVKRNRKKKLRFLKYMYKENKIVVNVAAFVIFGIILIVLLSIILGKEKINREGFVYNINNFNIKVNKTMLLKEDFKGNVLTENNLIVLELSLQSNFKGVTLFSKDFSLEIGETIFVPQTKYADKLLDLGKIYRNNALTNNYEKYLLVFEIQDKYLLSDMFLNFNNEGVKVKIKLNPQNFISKEVISLKNINDEMSFEETLGPISFNIKSFDIKEKFLINYEYCVQNDCILSKEYIKPSINENFDKYVLKLSVDFIDNSDLDLATFYDFFSKFGTIYYKIGDTWFSQSNRFEELKSKKVESKENVYIGVNSDISLAESIKFIFNIRNSRYEYVLR